MPLIGTVRAVRLDGEITVTLLRETEQEGVNLAKQQGPSGSRCGSHLHEAHSPVLLLLRSWVMDLISAISYPLAPEGLQSGLCHHLL